MPLNFWGGGPQCAMLYYIPIEYDCQLDGYGFEYTAANRPSVSTTHIHSSVAGYVCVVRVGTA